MNPKPSRSYPSPATCCSAKPPQAVQSPSPPNVRKLTKLNVRLLWQLTTDWAVRKAELLCCGGVLVGVGLHVARWVLPPPARLPWLHDRMAITTAFGGFAVAAVYLQVRQWLEEHEEEGEDGGRERGRGKGRGLEGGSGKARRKAD